MAQTLEKFLLELGNSVSLRDYYSDPSKHMRRFGLSEPEIQAVLSEDEGKIRALLANQGAGVVTMLILFPSTVPKRKLADFLLALGNEVKLSDYYERPKEVMKGFGLSQNAIDAMLSEDEEAVRAILEQEGTDYDFKLLLFATSAPERVRE